jgi:hypothetical protein
LAWALLGLRIIFIRRGLIFSEWFEGRGLYFRLFYG